MENKLEGPISLLIVAFLITLGPLAIFSDGSSADPDASNMTLRTLEPIPMDLDSQAKTFFSSMNGLSNEINLDPNAESKSRGMDHQIGDKASYYVSYWGKWAYNETDPSEFMTFSKRGESANCEIWVADDLTYMSWDERNSDVSKITITNEQVNYMLSEWETNIFPEMTDLIGLPDPLDGTGSPAADMGWDSFPTSSPGKVMIMVFNIADDFFWDPSVEYYGQGFFEPRTHGRLWQERDPSELL